jgi:hypothetical protein
MTKNSTYVTAYLDYCQVVDRLHATAMREGSDEAFEAWKQALDHHNEMWDAAVANGWTIAELDAAYERRFGRKVNRKV